MAKDIERDGFGLGADPEAVFIIKKTGLIRSPHDIIFDPDPHDHIGQARAIGVDGNRHTSSFEIRPGVSSSGMDLVNRIGELISKLHNYYHPPGIQYRCGAYWDPEPLGGHEHVSWSDKASPFEHEYADKMWQLCELMKALAVKVDYLTPLLFDKEQVILRLKYARIHNNDFGNKTAIRPPTLQEVINEGHIEYRYPPSWLDSPEAAYCFLGGLEFVVREVLTSPVGKRRDWGKFVEMMFTDPGVAPPKSPSLAHALDVAKKFVNQANFAETWLP